jgi:hypothetical protein
MLMSHFICQTRWNTSFEVVFQTIISHGWQVTGSMIDRPFIVLTETKPSKRHIPVWARYSPHRTRVEAHANMLSP